MDEFDQPSFDDALYRQKRKHGKFRFVLPPKAEGPIADTHAHVHLLPDPPLAFARAAVWGIDFVCNIIDIHGGEPATFDKLDGWLDEATSRIPQLLNDTQAVVIAGGSEETSSHFPEGCDVDAFAPACPDVSELRAPRVRLAVGCHPHNASHYDEALEAALLERLADPRVCAIGEIGLDYHYDLSPRDVQRDVFRRQLRLAHETGLPVALHIREAHDDALQILQEEGLPKAGVLLHCFDLDWETLEPWVNAGCYVAFGGALTFKKADYTRDAAMRAPKNLLLTETDSPYMTPEPMRGMVCEPFHTLFTADCLAETRVSAGECAGAGDAFAAKARVLAQLHDNALGLLDRQPTSWQLERAAQGA